MVAGAAPCRRAGDAGRDRGGYSCAMGSRRTREGLADARRVVGPAALPETGFTARVVLSGLPAGRTIVCRVLFQDLAARLHDVSGRELFSEALTSGPAS